MGAFAPILMPCPSYEPGVAKASLIDRKHRPSLNLLNGNRQNWVCSSSARNGEVHLRAKSSMSF